MVRPGLVLMLSKWWAVAMASALVLVSVPNAAAEAGEFTVLLEDGGDAAPIFDIVTVEAMHDATSLYLRGTLASAPPSGDMATIFFGFTVAGREVVSGGTMLGDPDTRNIGDPVPPDECGVDGAVLTCRYAYETVGASPNELITNVWAFTDMVVAGSSFPGDTAPGINIDNWPATNGVEYLLECGTNGLACWGGDKDEGPVSHTFFEDLDDLSIEHSFTNATNATHDTYVYNWTTDLTDLTFGWNASVQNGSVAFKAFDPDGIQVVNQTLNATTGQPVGEADVTAFIGGQWNITIEYTEFVGDFSFFQVIEQTVNETAPEPERNLTAERLAAAQQAFPLQSESEALPGVPVIALVGAVAVAAMARRQR